MPKESSENLRPEVDERKETVNLRDGAAGELVEVEFFPEGPGSRIGAYKLLQQLGEGGMGSVFLAEQEHPVRRQVALKIIKPGMDSKEVIARFEAERQALALMDHPNICKVLDAGATPSGRPFFVMDLVKGISITRYCDERRLTPRERLELFIPVCQAVQHAHQKGIIHRDLKPSNILVAMYDDKPVPKVIDFGVAKATGQQLTERTLFTGLGAIVGTLEYMSPEQAKMNALDIDTRTDVYSLGVILYELLTSETPLHRNRAKQAALDEVLRVIREEEPVKPSTHVSASDALPAISAQRGTGPAELREMLRGEVDWIVMKALEKDRGRRYESATGLAQDIQRYLTDEAVEACPPSVGYRLKKLARRHKKVLVSATAFIALLLIGVVVATWQAVRASLAEAEANVQRDAAVVSEKKARENAETAREERDKARAAKEELRRIYYVSQMNLVQNAWEANNVEQILDLLKSKPLEPGETDLRGFEWHYWRRLCNAELETVRLVEKGGTFSFNADGTRVASLCNDGAIRVWETAGGKELLSIPGQGLALSPDGKQLAVVSFRDDLNGVANDVEVWDIAAKTRTFQVKLAGLKGPTLLRSAPFLAFDSPGHRLAVAGRVDKTAEIQVWDLVANKVVFTRTISGGSFNQPGFSPDGQLLAAPLDLGKSPATRRVQVWNVADNKDLFAVENLKLDRSIPGALGRFLAPTHCWAFSPDSKRLATGEWGVEEKIKVWDTAKGQLLFSFSEPMGKPTALAFSPDGAGLAVLGHGKIATVWDLPAGPGKIVRQPALTLKWSPIPDREASALAFSADGQRLFTAEINSAVKIWDAHPGRTFSLASRLTKKGKLPNRHLSPNGAFLCTAVGPGDGVGEMDVWNDKGIRTGRIPFSVRPSSETFFGLVAFHPHGRSVMTAIPEGLALWETATANRKYTIPALPGMSSAVFTADGKRLATLAPPQVSFWDAEDGRAQLTLKVGARTEKLSLSRDGQRFCLVEQGDDDAQGRHELKCWDLARDWEPRTLFVSPGRIRHTAFSPDGQHIAATIDGKSILGSWGMKTHGEVKVWNADTGKERFTLNTPSGHVFNALVFSPDGRRLATAENDENGTAHVVKLWDVATGGEVLTLRPAGKLTKLGFSADGYRLSGLLLYAGPHGDLVQVWDATPK